MTFIGGGRVPAVGGFDETGVASALTLKKSKMEVRPHGEGIPDREVSP